MSSERANGRDGVVEYRGTGLKVSLVLIFLTAALLLILAVQNTAPVPLAFLAWEVELPLFALILGAGLIGVALDELIGLVWRRQRRKRLAERAELAQLRAGQGAAAESGGQAEPGGTSASDPSEATPSGSDPTGETSDGDPPHR